MSVPFAQEVEFLQPNRFFNLVLTHVSGPLRGADVHFTSVQAKKAPISVICSCQAYNHPHAKGRGKCQTNTAQT